MIRRGEFITLLGGAAAAWPVVARGQQTAMPVIGVLQAGSPDSDVDRMHHFRKGLSEIGYAEGRNVMIEYRWAQNDYSQLPILAAELVRRPVRVLYAAGGTPTALAAKAATSSIPIVFQFAADPVEAGVVTSVNRPGGNVTGVAAFSNELTAKRLEIIRELIPAISVVAFLNDPTTPVGEKRRDAFEAAALATGLKFNVMRAGSERQIHEAFENFAKQNIYAVVVQGSPRFVSRRELIAELAAQYRVAAIYEQPENARSGGLISYGSSILEANRLGGTYVGRILKGEKPADMPIMLPTKFELVINLKTAKALGLTVRLRCSLALTR